MDNNLKIIPISKIFSNVHYEVPIYQRNYAWGTEQIEQLIEDIMSSQGDYFLGNLIVNQKDNNVYEVIDGQQRLTTLYLLERYLNINFSQDSLRFEAREKSNKTLKNLPDTSQLIDELQSPEIISGFKIIDEYFKKFSLNNDKESFIKRLDDVKLIRVQVPKNIDLNHYFEIMNTRGEQLELHEIAKANFLSKISSKEDKLIANDIWEYCSNMNYYIQMNYPVERRNKIFGNNWSDLSSEIVDFDSLKPFYDKNLEVEERFSLEQILEGEVENSRLNKFDEEQVNERFKSIISFPNFLLQVSSAIPCDDDDLSLDDRNFLKNLSKHWQDEASAKYYLFTLLKARVIFDKYILKSEQARDNKETEKWSLQRLEKYKDKKSNKPVSVYVKTFDDAKRNKQIRTLQSALRITYTSPKTMHWISLIISSYLHDSDIDILKILEEYAQSKVEDSQYTTASGFGFERIVFSYLDYLLYRDGYSYEGEEIISPLTDKWKFQFRSSIEHFYPQNPQECPKWADSDVNCFGNLAFITVSGNSKFSNNDPSGKFKTNPSIIKESLKLQIMAKMMEKNSNNWTQDLAHRHQEEMFKLIRKNLNSESEAF